MSTASWAFRPLSRAPLLQKETAAPRAPMTSSPGRKCVQGASGWGNGVKRRQPGFKRVYDRALVKPQPQEPPQRPSNSISRAAFSVSLSRVGGCASVQGTLAHEIASRLQLVLFRPTASHVASCHARNGPGWSEMTTGSRGGGGIVGEH